MRLKDDCVVTTIGTETVIVPTYELDFQGIVRGNKTLADIAGLLAEETTEEAIVAALHGRYEAADGAIESSVSRAIATFRELDLLDE